MRRDEAGSGCDGLEVDKNKILKITVTSSPFFVFFS